eukprot:tig00000949_g5755.t1
MASAPDPHDSAKPDPPPHPPDPPSAKPAALSTPVHHPHTTHQHTPRQRSFVLSDSKVQLVKAAKDSESSPDIVGLDKESAKHHFEKLETKLLEKLDEDQAQVVYSKPRPVFQFSDAMPTVKSAIANMIEDDFTKCFQSRQPERWNWNFYLFPIWAVGVVVRYGILFPLRLLALVTGFLSFVIAFTAVRNTVRDVKRRQQYERSLISFCCGVFVMSWSGVIKYHGTRPPRRANQVFVANHTSMIDFIILQQMASYATVGQHHPGWVGWCQDNLLACLGCIWFDRKAAEDRATVSRLLKEHIAKADNNPLLIFPEGTCVNNEYCCMFKRGSFELGATVYPVAIKYNKIFVDAFWNSRQQSFAQHLFHLMTSWCVVCDVWYLEPQTIRPNEDAIAFANRVKTIIASKAGLVEVPWDGYLKYFQPSKKFTEAKQRKFAEALLGRYAADPSVPFVAPPGEDGEARAAGQGPGAAGLTRRHVSESE